jgi:predicted DNA-binding transcriptional regulator YafY
MPKSDAHTKADRHYRLRKLFEQPKQRLRTIEIAEKLGVSEDTAMRDINELSHNGRLPLRKDGQHWILAEDARLEQLHVHLNLAEATALYVAGRLLSQIHDERNRHIIMALTRLTDALPEALQIHQHTLIDLAAQREQGQTDRSHIFEALTIGWSTRRKVRLLYTPPRKRKFECLFDPYLLEPSGIGRTIYAIGKSSIGNTWRTYKLERIESAQVTDEPFEVDEDFDGPALLQRSWGVMYGDEDLVKVHLRFTHLVAHRVKETLWHSSQKLLDTAEGCELVIYIGDTLEIENWIRGWGSDCEVLAPNDLREKMITDVHRSARKYGITSHASDDDGSILDSFFGG